MLLKEYYQSMYGKLNEAEVDDDQMIKFKSSDGENKEMPASSAKKMTKDHPAKIAYDKLAGGDDGGDAKPGVNIFDDPEKPADEPSDMDTEKPDDEPDDTSWGKDAEDAAGDIDEWMPEDALGDWQEMMDDDPDVDDVVDFIVNNETGLEQHYSGDIEDLARQFTDKEGSEEPSGEEPSGEDTMDNLKWGDSEFTPDTNRQAKHWTDKKWRNDNKELKLKISNSGADYFLSDPNRLQNFKDNPESAAELMKDKNWPPEVVQHFKDIGVLGGESPEEPSGEEPGGGDAEDAAYDIEEWMPEDALGDWQEMMDDDPDVDDVVDFIVNNESGLDQHYAGDIKDLARQFIDKEGSEEPSGEKEDQLFDNPLKMFDDMDIGYEETEDEDGNKKYELEDGRELTFTDKGVVVNDDDNEEIEQWPYPPENWGYETVKDEDGRDLPVVPHDHWMEEAQEYLGKRFPEENKEARIPAYGSFQETQIQWVKDNITF